MTTHFILYFTIFRAIFYDVFLSFGVCFALDSGSKSRHRQESIKFCVFYCSIHFGERWEKKSFHKQEKIYDFSVKLWKRWKRRKEAVAKDKVERVSLVGFVADVPFHHKLPFHLLAQLRYDIFLGRKANLLNWLLLLFRCFAFYIRHQHKVKDGEMSDFHTQGHVHRR